MKIIYIISIILGLGYFFYLLKNVITFFISLIKREKNEINLFQKINPFYFANELITNDSSIYIKKIIIKFFNDYISILLVFLIFFGISAFFIPYTSLGNTDLNSQFHKKNFTSFYFAEVQLEENYDLYSKVIVKLNYSSSKDPENHNDTGILLTNIYFKNGTESRIENTNGKVWFDSTAIIYTSDGRSWYLELIDEKPTKENLLSYNILE